MILLKTNTELDGKAPDEITIFPAGEVRIAGADSAMMDELAAENILSCVEASDADMVIDYEHQTLYGGVAPAAGWLKDFKWEPKVGFIGRCEWTDAGRRYIESREYRYFSPVFDVCRDTNRIMRLHNVALTNQPRMQNITPLIAKQEAGIMPEKEKDDVKEVAAAKPSMPKLRKKLGFGDDVPDMIVEQKVLALLKEYDSKKDQKAAKAVLDALDMTEEATEAEVVARVHVLTNKPDLSEDVKSLQDQIGVLESVAAKREFGELLKQGVTAGKIYPADADDPDSFVCKLDMETLKSYIAQAPVIVPVERVEVAKVDRTASMRTFASEHGFDTISDDDIAKYDEGE